MWWLVREKGNVIIIIIITLLLFGGGGENVSAANGGDMGEGLVNDSGSGTAAIHEKGGQFRYLGVGSLLSRSHVVEAKKLRERNSIHARESGRRCGMDS